MPDLALQRKSGKNGKVANQRQTRGEASDDVADLRNNRQCKSSNDRHDTVQNSSIGDVLLHALDSASTTLDDVLNDVLGVVDDEVAQSLRCDLGEVDGHGLEDTADDLVTARVGQDVLGGRVEDGEGDDVVGLDVGPDNVDNVVSLVDGGVAAKEAVDGLEDGESGGRGGGGGDEGERETHIDGIKWV